MRLQIQTVGPITIINDCYNANPVSMANALDCLSQVGAGHRKVFICGTMAELGKQSENLHQELGRRVAESGVALLLAAGDFADVVAEVAKTSAYDEDFKAFVFKSTDELCNNLSRFVQRDDIVLVKGSRSAKLEQAVVKLEVKKFDA
jgi:UDP-N-acetylmuramoyl-tripeptide--D-alanyl-D-alanine ligase